LARAGRGPAVAAPGPEADEEGGSADWVLVLACDVPRAREIVPALLEAARTADAEVDVVCVVDDGGRRQSLVALHRRARLRSAVARLRRSGGLDGVAVRRLMTDLVTLTVPDPDHAGRDADTWEDVRTLEDEITRRNV
ncbi:molybdenum cofactor guanylyltransferase, partial [Actinotalea sp. C106]|uniref:molybdenum cofactor guanylyltransferase n=1 Tax=Actinotalea sp. C106 TaxID=2908644 RepID=UPI0020282C3C